MENVSTKMLDYLNGLEDEAERFLRKAFGPIVKHDYSVKTLKYLESCRDRCEQRVTLFDNLCSECSIEPERLLVLMRARKVEKLTEEATNHESMYE